MTRTFVTIAAAMLLCASSPALAADTAFSRWYDCLRAEADLMMNSPESAVVISDAAMGACAGSQSRYEQEHGYRARQNGLSPFDPDVIQIFHESVEANRKALVGYIIRQRARP